MDQHLLYLREEYGDVFVTQLPSGQTIPWRPLSMGEFIEYQDSLRAGVHPVAYLENEIFKKCVLDKAIIQGFKQLKAGIISTVVANIISESGPTTVDELNQVLNFNRNAAGKVLNDLVIFVCQAFPAYKPEDVYAMDYPTLMLRVAMSERKMLQTGFITEPLHFENPEIKQQQQVQTEEERIKRREENSKMLDKYYEQQGIKVPDSVKKARAELREKIIVHPAPPPLSIASKERTIITTTDIAEHQAILSGHEKDIVHQHNVAKNTASIYQHYLDDLAEGKQLRILSDEERKAAALERMEKNRLANLERRKVIMEEAKKELPELLKAREEARKRKERKAARLRNK